jgi:MOSC domain-containing protein YiiM
MTATVLAVHVSPTHSMRKFTAPSLHLIAGSGVEGDAHAGVTVKHRSRVAADPTQPNLRQVHLVHSELFDELRAQGFLLSPGLIGENVTTRGIDLLGLPRGTLLTMGAEAVVEVTGLRNPCTQLDGIQQGLMRACLGRDADGEPIRKAGIMGIVRAGGIVTAGDAIAITLPPSPHEKLQRV